MASRVETAERRAQLRRDLIQSRGQGGWRAGELALSQRDLAQKYGLSQSTIAQEIRKLTGEGVLHCVPRVGTFAGMPSAMGTEFYLLLTRDGSLGDAQFRQTQNGFEEAIARRGDAVLMLEKSAALERCARGAMPELAGVFDLAFWPGAPSLELLGQEVAPRVSAAKRFETRPGYDLVSFDDVEGGRLAARHLLARGHKQIAFLAVHRARGASSLVDWSQERETGWRQALREAGVVADELAFHPHKDAMELAIRPSNGAISRAAKGEFAETVQALLARPDITAVVAANDHAALELLAALRASKTPQHLWPAIVGFDNDPLAQDQLLTSLHLPFDELGRAAGELLWERRHARVGELPQRRIVQMRVIPRLTCLPKWAGNSTASALPARELAPPATR